MGVCYKPKQRQQAKPKIERVDRFAIGPVVGYEDSGFLGTPGFKVGPLRHLEDAYEYPAEEGDAIWCLPPFGEDYIVDVWADERWAYGECHAAGWVGQVYRQEALDMAKRNYADAAGPPATTGGKAGPGGAVPPRPARTPPSGVNPDRIVEQQPGNSPMPPGLAAASGPAIHATKNGVEVVDGEDADAARAAAAKANLVGDEFVFICIGRTVSPRQFESLRIDVGRCRAIRPGETFEDVENATIAEVATKLRTLEEEAIALFSAGQQG